LFKLNPYIVINIAFLFLAPLAYVYSNVFSYILACASWVLLFPIFTIIYKINPINASIPIIVFNLLQMGFIMYKKMLQTDRLAHASRLEEESGNMSHLLGEFEKLERFEVGIRTKEAMIVNLYEITKKMSEDLRFDDIFEVFSVFLKENFTFTRCDLLILSWGNNISRLDRKYSVLKEGRTRPAADIANYDKLIKWISQNPKEIYMSRRDNPQDFKNFEIEGTSVETFIGMPLLSENRIVGILALENLAREYLEKFAILSIQFSLEIRKVLLYETVERLAITDSVTGLYVRRYFSERFSEELERSKRYKFTFAFLMIDIDGFKNCNDTYGHLVGDVVLRDIAHLIKENLREIDIVSRYGGEEFAVLLPETGLEGARLAAERLRKRIEDNLFIAYDEKLRLTISIGMALYPKDSGEEKTLIEKADLALYEAKGLGKNVVCEYKKEYNVS